TIRESIGPQSTSLEARSRQCVAVRAAVAPPDRGVAPTRRFGLSDRLEKPADAGGVRPRGKAAARPLRAGGGLELSPDGPVVGRAPAPNELGAVVPHEAVVHLEAAVVAVAGVRRPGSLV